MNKECKVKTGIVRMSYLNVLEPRCQEGQEPRYSVSLVIPKTDTKTVNAIQAAIQAAYEDGMDKLRTGKTVPPLASLKTPLRDGDAERPEDPVYAGSWFINASCPDTRAPQVVDKFGRILTTEDTVYSGMYGRATVVMYAFNKNGNKGIACGLNNLLKTADGERLGGCASALDDFADDIDSDINTVDSYTGEVLSDGATPF